MTNIPLQEPMFSRTVRGSGPGLVLAHGAGGSVMANFGPIFDGLATDRTAVGVDYPGAGSTPRALRPLTTDSLADPLIAAAVREGLESFAIAGWALAGAVGIRAAARHPDRVTALVLTSAFAHADAPLRLAASVWHDLYQTGDHVLLFKFLMLISRGARALEAMTPEQQEAASRQAAKFVPP